MLTLRRLLFATDHTRCADRAFGHAAFLAAHHGAELRVLHVAPVTGSDDTEALAYAAPDGVTLVAETRRAPDAAEAIVEAARDADLVVMGTHGRRGLGRLTIGRTAEHVMRHADCPVLAVGLGAARPAPEAVERLLVPVDFSDSSGPALAVADALADVYGARVDGLHAVFVPDLPDVYGLGLQMPALYPDVVARTREALGALLRRFVAPERRGEATVRVGPPGPTILDEAARQRSGLVVMPTHGRTGLARLAAGSVAETVLRRAPCAVLALPSFGRLPLPAAVARPVPREADAPLGDPAANVAA